MFKDTDHKIINLTTASTLKTQLPDLIRLLNSQGYEIQFFNGLVKVKMVISKHVSGEKK